MTTTIATAFTPDQMLSLGHSVFSSAMRSWALVMDDNGAELLVLFHSNDTVYRYAFRGFDAARKWDGLRHWNDEAECEEEEVSWGRQFNTFLRQGWLLPIAA
jgi:hypothetical protein